MSKTLEEEFYILLGKMAYGYAHLEVTVGYCLRYVVNPQNPTLVNPLLVGRSMVEKLRQLRQVVEYRYGQENPEFMDRLNSWLREMDDFRAKRNRYIHGLWQVCPIPGIEKPIMLNSDPWQLSKPNKGLTEDTTQYMELDELITVVKKLEELQTSFSSLFDRLLEIMVATAREERHS